MPHDVQGHDVLAPFLGIRCQFRCCVAIHFGISVARSCAFHRFTDHTTTIEGEVPFWTCTKGEPIPIPIERCEGCLRSREQCCERSEWIEVRSVGGTCGAIVHLVDVAALDMIEQVTYVFDVRGLRGVMMPFERCSGGRLVWLMSKRCFRPFPRLFRFLRRYMHERLLPYPLQHHVRDPPLDLVLFHRYTVEECILPFIPQRSTRPIQ